MPHYKSMFDRDYLAAFDLNGKDVVVEIAKVEAGSLTGAGGRKTRKPIVRFVAKEKALALNATNGKILAGMYGEYTEEWVGKSVTLYATTTTMGSDTVPCIRIRPTQPKGK